MKLYQIHASTDRNNIQDQIDLAELGDYIIIAKPIEIVNRKVFAALLKAEINKKYGEVNAAKVTENARNHLNDAKTLYPSSACYGDTDSIAIFKNYYLISYAWHLYGYPNDWHYENTVTDSNPNDWIVEKANSKNKTVLLNATVISKDRYEQLKEVMKID